MLGITYHNPATISVFLDRLRFRDCFISIAELRDGEWRRKLKSFVDLPRDGRDRVLFVESFAALQTLLQHGAVLDAVKVAVYDDCAVLSNVPGTSIVDAHINGAETDTWQLYTVSFQEFNDALAAQPVGVPALLRDHDVKEDADLPVAPRLESKESSASEQGPDTEQERPASMLVMEQILDNIEADEDDEASEPFYEEPAGTPDPAVTARPEISKKSATAEVVESVKPTEEPQQTADAEAPVKKKQRKKRVKKPKLESYELF